MNTYRNYCLVKQASSLFTPHQRMALQIGRMFERTKGKSQASQEVLNSQAGRGPSSMNDIAALKQQQDFDKQQKDFAKQQQAFEKDQEKFKSEQRKIQEMRDDVAHQQKLMQRERELRKLEASFKQPKQDTSKPDPVIQGINNHVRSTAQSLRRTAQRLLLR